MKDWLAPIVTGLVVALVLYLFSIQQDNIKQLTIRVDQLTQSYVQMTGHVLNELAK